MPVSAGFTLVEALIAMAVGSVTLAGVAGLLSASARAATDAELETTATLVATRTVEEWRSLTVAPLDGAAQYDRHGRETEADGLFAVRWRAEPDAAAANLWRLSVEVSSARLRAPVVTEAAVRRVW